MKWLNCFLSLTYRVKTIVHLRNPVTGLYNTVGQTSISANVTGQYRQNPSNNTTSTFFLAVNWLKYSTDSDSAVLYKKLVRVKDKACCVCSRLTFTHNPKDFKFIHHITNVREFHEVKRCVMSGASGSGRGGPATKQQVAAGPSPQSAVINLEAMISGTCL